MEKSPSITIIILNYNAGKILLDCVSSVLKSDYNNFEVLVIDNNSKDHSHKDCKKKFPQIKLIENNDNLGYCEGNNVGIRNTNSEFIVILNPDTIVEPTWLKGFIDSYKQFGEGLYQPKFLSIDDKKILGSTGNKIQLFGFGYARGLYDLDEGQYDEPKEINYASGTCLFTSKKIMQSLGMFDSFIFAYHDDLDLGWRASQIGIKSWYNPKSIVYHHLEGYSFKWSKLKFFLIERNRHYCLLTHYSRSTFYKMLPSLVLVQIAIFIFYLKKGMAISIFKVFFDIIKNRKKIKQKYNEIQNNRKISDKELIINFEDKIFVPENISTKKVNMIFNRFIGTLSKITRKVI